MYPCVRVCPACYGFFLSKPYLMILQCSSRDNLDLPDCHGFFLSKLCPSSEIRLNSLEKYSKSAKVLFSSRDQKIYINSNILSVFRQKLDFRPKFGKPP